MRVTCVMEKQAEMEGHLQHEFSKQPPSLFYKRMVWKNTKSVLANLLKAPVDPASNDSLQNPYYIIDGGHPLQSVSWPTDLDCCSIHMVIFVTHM